MGVTPMFPLGTVLLPGAVLPLQIFEPRYRHMIVDLLAEDDRVPSFGVVLIERGHEVGGGEQRASIGTLAQVVDLQVAPDGRYALIATGTDRIRVREWLADEPYPRADTESWPDPTPPTAEQHATVAELATRVERLNADCRALGDVAPPDGVEISADPHLGLYHLAALAPIGPADRYRVLAAPSFSERLEVMISALDDAEATVNFRRS